MASTKPVEICVITKTYQGQEGNRVKAGTRFAVGNAQGDLPVITKNRYEQLRQNRLARPFDEKEDAAGLPPARYAPHPSKVAQIEGQGTSVTLARNVRQAVRSRARQNEEPEPPKQISAPPARSGSPTGKEAPASSSLAAPPRNSSTSNLRGTRRR